MKKKITLFFIFIIFFNLFINVFATEISSPSAVVICSDTGRILYDKNSKEKRKMASLTKVMTSILLIENCKLDEQINIAKESCYIGGSEVGLKPNDTVSAESLLY